MAKKPKVHQQPGKNRISDDEAASFVDRYEELEAQKLTYHAEFLNKCKAVNEEIKDLLEDAKTQGFKKGELKTTAKIRKLKRKILEATEDLEQDSKDRVVGVLEALGDDFSSFGLGAAVVRETAKADETAKQDPRTKAIVDKAEEEWAKNAPAGSA